MSAPHNQCQPSTSDDQFVSDMAESVNHIRATDRQKEVFKASLRFAITYAREKAKVRAALQSEKTP